MENDCMNARDLDTRSKLMTDADTFVDTTGQATAGRETPAGWRCFFFAIPDHRNHLARDHRRWPRHYGR